MPLPLCARSRLPPLRSVPGARGARRVPVTLLSPVGTRVTTTGWDIARCRSSQPALATHRGLGVTLTGSGCPCPVTGVSVPPVSRSPRSRVAPCAAKPPSPPREGISAGLFRLNNAGLLNPRRFQPGAAQRAFSSRRRQSARGRGQMDASGPGVPGCPEREGPREGPHEGPFRAGSQRTRCTGVSKRARSACASVRPCPSVSPGRCLSLQGHYVLGFPGMLWGLLPNMQVRLAARRVVLPPLLVPSPAQPVSPLVPLLCPEKTTGASERCQAGGADGTPTASGLVAGPCAPLLRGSPRCHHLSPVSLCPLPSPWHGAFLKQDGVRLWKPLHI